MTDQVDNEEKVEVKTPPKEQVSAFAPTGTHNPEDGNGIIPLNLLRGDIEALIKKHYPNAEDTISLLATAMVASSIDSFSEKSDELAKNLDKFLYNADESIKAGLSRFTPTVPQGEITSAEGVANLMIAAGVSDTWQMPLVNSGFRVRISTPDEDTQVLLDEKIITRMGELGRHTYGASFSNTSAYMDTEIMQFFLDHVVAHNIEGVALKDKGTLRKYIRAADFNSIITLLVHATNRDGYDVVVPCPGEKCKHTTSGKITPSALIKFDSSLLTGTQRNIITRPMSVSVSIEELKKYQEEFGSYVPVKATHNGVTYEITPQHPLLHDKCRTGTIWCDGINNAVEKFLKREGKSDEPGNKTPIVDRLLEVNALSNFLPYIKSIRIFRQDNESGEYIMDNTITGTEAIHATCKKLVNIPGLLNSFIKTINDISAEHNAVAVGVPAFVCPSCHKVSPTEFVPVNIRTQFFIRALGQKAMLTYLAAG